MTEVTSSQDTVDNCIDELEENKSEIVDSLAEESGLDSDEGRDMIESAVDNLVLDQKFKDKRVEKERVTSSITEDLKGLFSRPEVITKASITDVNEGYYNGKIQVEFTVSQNENDVFTKKFSYSDDKMSEELEDLFLLAGVQSGKPSELIGNSIPVTHNHKGGSDFRYSIHSPPKKSGFLPKIVYWSSRFVREAKLVSLAKNRRRDIKYRPTLRSYIAIFVSLILIPSLVLSTAGMEVIGATGVMILICMMCVHGFTILESHDYL